MERMFRYKQILPRQYIMHLMSKSVTLDERMTETIFTNFRRGWQEDTHLSVFALRLNEEQLKLINNSIVISEVDKNHHCMLQIW